MMAYFMRSDYTGYVLAMREMGLIKEGRRVLKKTFVY